MAFVEHLAKPTEYLPSAEVQLERREAEKAASLGTYLVVFFVSPIMLKESCQSWNILKCFCSQHVFLII